MQFPRGATPSSRSRRRRELCCRGQPLADCDFNLAAQYPAYPSSAERTRRERRHPKASTPRRASVLDPIENNPSTPAVCARDQCRAG